MDDGQMAEKGKRSRDQKKKHEVINIIICKRQG